MRTAPVKLYDIDDVVNSAIKNARPFLERGIEPMLNLNLKINNLTLDLDECERIKKCCQIKNFKEPSDNNSSGTKMEGFCELINKGENIVTTHALFRLYADANTLSAIKEKNYVIIFDEVFTMLEPLKIAESDIKLLTLKDDDGNSPVFIDDNGKASWNEKCSAAKNYEGSFSEFKKYVDTGNVRYISNAFFIWTMPIDKLDSFKKVYVMTFMFDSSNMKLYLDIFGIKYNQYYVHRDDFNVYSLSKEPVDYNFKNIVRPLLYIINGKVNDGYEKALSYTWYEQKKGETDRDYKERLKQIGKNCRNIASNKMNLKSSKTLWTVYEDYSFGKGKKNTIGFSGYNDDFLAMNTKATNKYKDRRVVLYLVNRYLHPAVKEFFTMNGIIIRKKDEEDFAFSEMVQFIWRSAIREGKPILLYIPSERMRNLLKNKIGLDEKLNFIDYKDLSENTLNEIEERAKHYHDNTDIVTEDDRKILEYDNPYIPPEYTAANWEEHEAYQKHREEHINRGRNIDTDLKVS